ncbi:hypothetical protein PO909_020742 [Leuciscus waleckii]
MPLHNSHWSLEFYIDLALQLSGSTFAVGVAEEEHDIPAIPATPKCPAVTAATPESPVGIPSAPSGPPASALSNPSVSALSNPPAITPPVSEVDLSSSVLPMMALCVWAAHTSLVSPEEAATFSSELLNTIPDLSVSPDVSVPAICTVSESSLSSGCANSIHGADFEFPVLRSRSTAVATATLRKNFATPELSQNKI